MSSSPSNFAPIIETLISLLYPFEWNSIVIPVISSSTIDFIDAPVPFIIGIPTDVYVKYSKRVNNVEEVLVINIDENEEILEGDGLEIAEVFDDCSEKI